MYLYDQHGNRIGKLLPGNTMAMTLYTTAPSATLDFAQLYDLYIPEEPLQQDHWRAWEETELRESSERRYKLRISNFDDKADLVRVVIEIEYTALDNAGAAAARAARVAGDAVGSYYPGCCKGRRGRRYRRYHRH